MDRKANEITSRQVFIFVISAQIAFGILSLASTLAEKIGHNAWMAVAIAGVASALSIVLIVATLKRFGNKNILQINRLLFGKYLGFVLNVFMVAYPIYTTSIMMRMFTNIIKLSTLRNTPPLVGAVFTVIPVIYLSWYGLKYICRYSNIKFILIIIVSAYYFLLYKYLRFTFIQPIGNIGFSELFKASFVPYTSFMGFELLTFIYPFIKEKKKVLKSALWAHGFTVSFYLLTVIILTCFFGEEMLKQLIFPVFSLARAYRAPVIERLDLFFISLWFPIMLSAVMAYFFCGYNSLKELLEIENDKGKCRITISIYTALIILLSRAPKDMIQLNTLFDALGLIATGYIGYIFLIYLLSFIKKGNKGNEKAL